MSLKQIPKGTAFVGSLEKPAFEASLKDRALESSKKRNSKAEPSWASLQAGPDKMKPKSNKNRCKIEAGPVYGSIWQSRGAQER